MHKTLSQDVVQALVVMITVPILNRHLHCQKQYFVTDRLIKYMVLVLKPIVPPVRAAKRVDGWSFGNGWQRQELSAAVLCSVMDCRTVFAEGIIVCAGTGALAYFWQHVMASAEGVQGGFNARGTLQLSSHISCLCLTVMRAHQCPYNMHGSQLVTVCCAPAVIVRLITWPGRHS